MRYFCISINSQETKQAVCQPEGKNGVPFESKHKCCINEKRGDAIQVN